MICNQCLNYIGDYTLEGICADCKKVGKYENDLRMAKGNRQG